MCNGGQRKLHTIRPELDLLVLLLPLDAALDGLLFVGDAALELEDALLPVALLLLDVLHQVVEDVLRLQLLLFGGARLALLDVEHLLLVAQ